MTSIKASVICCALVLATVTGSVLAQPCVTPNKLIGSSPTPGDQLGSGVSLSFGGPNNRPLLAIGKPGEDTPSGLDAGAWSIWQFVNGNWSMVTEASHAAGQPGERAGTSISLADPYMIVGAPEYNDRGRVMFLRRADGSSTWQSDGESWTGFVNGALGSRFGNAVAISAYNGGWAIVGAQFFSQTFANSGAIYVYVRNASTGQWLVSYSLEGEGYFGQVNGRRGTSVAMSQTSPWAAFGAPRESSSAQSPENGVAYVFQRGNNFSEAIHSPVQETGQQFGTAIAVEGNWLAVGAPLEDGSSQETGLPADVTDSGAVYIYERSNNAWTYRTTLRAPIPTQGGWFGSRVALSDSQLVVSEFWRNQTYVYRRNATSWSLQSSFRDPDDSSSHGYAQSIAINNGQVAVGDLFNDHSNASDAGAVYTTFVSPSQPTGDTCSDPLPMPTSDFVGCTDYATRSIGTVTTCGTGGGGQGNDVWFRFQPACDGNAIIDTWGSGFDTVLSVHSDCPDASGGHSIACNDDAGFPAPNNMISLVTFNFQGGHAYLVRVTGYNTASGQFSLRSLLNYGVNNDECRTASTVAMGSYTFNNCAATNSPNAGVPLGSSHDIWYRFIAPAAGWYSFDTCGSSFDTVVTVFSGTQQACPTNAAAMITQNDDSVGVCSPLVVSRQSYVKLQASQGQSMMIRVGGYNSSEFGAGTLTISLTSQCNDIDFNNDGSVFDPTDIEAFLSRYSEGPCIPAAATCDSIDFNNDTSIFDPMDINSFLSVYSEGPCF